MQGHDREKYVNRDGILKLLSDAEVARVSMAETAERLLKGEEYLDLEHLDWGVQSAVGATAPMGHVLPRKAVEPETWDKILKYLAAPRLPPPRSDGQKGESL